MNAGPVTAATPVPPPTEAAPAYRKVRHDNNLWLITCDEGWRSTVLCSGMYEDDADWLLTLLGRTSRGAR